MKQHTQTEAIVLKRWDYGEKDQIVNFFSKDHGRMQGIAKGARGSRHRFLGCLDLFSYISLSYQDKKSGTLVLMDQAELLCGFPNIRKTYAALMLATSLLEMAYRFYHEGEKDLRGFHVLKDSLYALENQKGQKEVFWSALLHHLKIMGVLPSFQEDLQYGKQSFQLSDSLKARLQEIPSEKFENFSFTLEEENILHPLLRTHLQYQLELDIDWAPFFQGVE